MDRNINQELSEQFTPLFYRLTDTIQKSAYQHLLSENKSLRVFDEMDGQIKELIKSLHPSKKISDAEYPPLVEAHLKGTDIKEYGVWAYYPWLNCVVHILDEEEFVEVRTNRNRYKITREEQALLGSRKIGVIGLSVGQSIALTLAQERTCGELRLADFDTAELSNLNRIRTGVQNLGLRKTVIAAREIAELDPYLKVIIFNDGLTKQNIDDFFTGGSGKLDLVVEVCDGLDVKIQSRYKARELRIPVVMDTNDRGMLDVERFDLEPDREILHGLAEGLKPELLEQMNPQQRMAAVMKMVGVDTLSGRMKASMLEINNTINTWPQLASSVTLGGAITTDVCRRILLGEHNASGRFYIDLEELIPSTKVEPENEVDAEISEDDIQRATTTYLNAYGQGTGIVSEEQLEALSAAAIKAPWLYNEQPFRLHYAKGLLFLIYTGTSLKWTDADEIQSYLSIGGVLENIHSEAHNLGFEVKVHPPLTSDGLLTIGLDFVNGTRQQDDNTLKLVSDLHLAGGDSEKQFGKEIPLDFYQWISYFVRINDSLAVIKVDNKEDIAILSDWVASLERIKFLNRNGHKEFFSMLRWNGEEKGMKISSFSESEQGIYSILRDEKVASWLAKWDKGGVIGQLAKVSLLGSEEMLLISVKQTNKEQLIEIGRTLQQLRTAATISGVSVQNIYIPAIWRIDNDGKAGNKEEINVLKERFLKIFPLGEEYKRGYTNVLLMKLSKVK